MGKSLSAQRSSVSRPEHDDLNNQLNFAPQRSGGQVPNSPIVIEMQTTLKTDKPQVYSETPSEKVHNAGESPLSPIQSSETLRYSPSDKLNEKMV
jgi:hypothetical protein